MITEKDVTEIKCDIAEIKTTLKYLEEKIDNYISYGKQISLRLWGALITAGVGLLLALAGMVK